MKGKPTGPKITPHVVSHTSPAPALKPTAQHHAPALAPTTHHPAPPLASTTHHPAPALAPTTHSPAPALVSTTHRPALATAHGMREKKLKTAEEAAKKLKITNEIAKKISKWAWTDETFAAAKGLNTGDTQQFANILTQVSWVKDPGTARYHNAIGMGIPNYDQLEAAKRDALSKAHGNASVTTAVNTFFNKVGNSDRYQEANFLTGTMNEQAVFQANWDEKHASKGVFWDIFLGIL